MSEIVDLLLPPALTASPTKRNVMGVNAHSHDSQRSERKADQRRDSYCPVGLSDRQGNAAAQQELNPIKQRSLVQSDHATVRNLLRSDPPDLDEAYRQLRWLLPWLDTRSRRLLRSDPTLFRALWLLVAAEGTEREPRGPGAWHQGKRWFGVGVFICITLSLLLILTNTLQAAQRFPRPAFQMAGAISAAPTSFGHPPRGDALDP